ncbi:Speckle-type POZ protein-like protein [Hordeum vulgare]|nr:Speckle-type POZ protein-like protein [Hordeum vulgare]
MDRSDEITSISTVVSSLRAAGRHHLSAGTFAVRPVTGSYLFRIEQFKQIQKMLGNDTMIESGTFRVGGHDWRLRCYPSGEEGYEGFIGLHLKHASLERTGDTTADFHMSILDHTCRKKSMMRAKAENLDDEEHLKDGCLSILCDVTVLDMRTTDYRDEMASTSTTAPPSELHRESMEVLSESKEGADPDLEIEVGRVTFPAKRPMLAARPPVFKTKLIPTKIRVAEEHCCRVLNEACTQFFADFSF